MDWQAGAGDRGSGGGGGSYILDASDTSTATLSVGAAPPASAPESLSLHPTQQHDAVLITSDESIAPRGIMTPAAALSSSTHSTTSSDLVASAPASSNYVLGSSGDSIDNFTSDSWVPSDTVFQPPTSASGSYSLASSTFSTSSLTSSTSSASALSYLPAGPAYLLEGDHFNASSQPGSEFPLFGDGDAAAAGWVPDEASFGQLPQITSTTPAATASNGRYRGLGRAGHTYQGVLDSPKDDPPQDEGGEWDWNIEFQKLLDEPDSVDKFARLGDLGRDFVFTAENYGRVIVSEIGLPPERKTIKPINAGGVAGGEKFLVGKIFFKFAVDLHGIYGGDSFAMKAAGKDLQGLTHFYNSGTNGIRVPLMALIDYLGYRLIALSCLPITETTLKYGSNDGGRTVHADDPIINDKMKNIAKLLNLKGHIVGTEQFNTQTLHAPVDIEVHDGTDNRYYALDFARLFPPEGRNLDEVKSERGRHLYKFLRPELVKTNDVPLSSDVFSRWSSLDPEKHKHEAEVAKATQEVYATIIPNFANGFELKGPFHNVIDLLHQRGICVRHLGIMYRMVAAKDPLASKRVLLEMLARIVKEMLRSTLRKVKERKMLSEAPARRAVVALLNKLLGVSEESKEFWKLDLSHELQRKFKLWNNPDLKAEYANNGVFQEELLPIMKPVIPTLILRSMSLASIELSREMKTVLRQKKTGKSDLDDSFKFIWCDIGRFNARIKHMNLVNFADAMAMFHESNLEIGAQSNRLLFFALDKIREAFKKFPFPPETLLSITLECLRRSLLFEQGGEYFYFDQTMRVNLRSTAFDCLTLLLQVYPKCLEGHLLMAECCAAANECQRAEAIFRAAIKNVARDAEDKIQILIRWVRAMARANRNREALAACEHLSELQQAMRSRSAQDSPHGPSESVQSGFVPRERGKYAVLLAEHGNTLLATAICGHNEFQATVQQAAERYEEALGLDAYVAKLIPFARFSGSTSVPRLTIDKQFEQSVHWPPETYSRFFEEELPLRSYALLSVPAHSQRFALQLASFLPTMRSLELSGLSSYALPKEVYPLLKDSLSSELEELKLEVAQCDDEALANLFARLPKLVVLHLSNATITQDTLQEITSNCPQLRKVRLSGCKAISNEALTDFVSRSANLRELSLARTQATNATLDALLKNATQIETLDISGCGAQFTVEAISALTAYVRMQQRPPAGIETASQPSLTALSLAGSIDPQSDKQQLVTALTEFLQQATELKHLNLKGQPWSSSFSYARLRQTLLNSTSILAVEFPWGRTSSIFAPYFPSASCHHFVPKGTKQVYTFSVNRQSGPNGIDVSLNVPGKTIKMWNLHKVVPGHWQLTSDPDRSQIMARVHDEHEAINGDEYRLPGSQYRLSSLELKMLGHTMQMRIGNTNEIVGNFSQMAGHQSSRFAIRDESRELTSTLMAGSAYHFNNGPFNDFGVCNLSAGAHQVTLTLGPRANINLVLLVAFHLVAPKSLI